MTHNDDPCSCDSCPCAESGDGCSDACNCDCQCVSTMKSKSIVSQHQFSKLTISALVTLTSVSRMTTSRDRASFGRPQDPGVWQIQLSDDKSIPKPFA